MVVMKELKSLNHLVSNHESCLESEFSLTIVEKVLERWSEEVHDHSIIISLNTEPVDSGNTRSSVENFVDFGFIKKLRELGLNWL